MRLASIYIPWRDLPDEVRQVLMHGAPKGKLKWAGILRDVAQRHKASSSDSVRDGLEEFMSVLPCNACGGARLKLKSLAVTIAGRSLGDALPCRWTMRCASSSACSISPACP